MLAGTSRGDGTSQEETIPTSWNGLTGDNIAWKTPIPGRGHSLRSFGMIRVFVTSCLEDKKKSGCLYALIGLQVTFNGNKRW